MALAARATAGRDPTPYMKPPSARHARCAASLLLALAGVSAARPQTVGAAAAQSLATAATPANDPTTPAPAAHRTSDRVAQEAEQAYLAGARSLEKDDLARAQSSFDRAQRLDPTNAAYKVATRLVVEHRVTQLIQQSGRARLLGHTATADQLLAQARTLDPTNDLVLQHEQAAGLQAATVVPTGSVIVSDPAAADEAPWRPHDPGLAGRILLRPNDSVQSFRIHADLRTAISQVFTRFGIRPVFDDSVKAEDTPQGVRFDLDNTTFRQAAPILLSMGRLFYVPVDATTVLVAADTAPNRMRLERLYQETLYTPGLNPQQMGEIANVIRQVFDVKQLSMQSEAGNITLRAPAGTLDALNATLRDLLEGTPEVLFDLKLYSVEKSRTRSIGPTLPQQFGVYNVASAAQSIVSANQTVVDQAISQGLITLGTNPVNNLLIEAAFLVQTGLATSSLLTNTIGFFGNGLTLTGATASSGVGLSLSLNSSDTRALDAIQMRVLDRQTATLKAGTRYPIITSTYSTGLSSTSASSLAGATINGVSVASLLSQYLGSNASGTTIPQIQYEDLGLTLKATPNVQQSGQITMHLDLKIEALTGASINNIPVLASRQFASDVTVPDGQTALMVSSLSRTESLAVSGLPGLAELPGLQSISADRDTDVDTADLVLLITPRTVRRRSNITLGPRIPISSSPDSSE